MIAAGHSALPWNFVMDNGHPRERQAISQPMHMFLEGEKKASGRGGRREGGSLSACAGASANLLECLGIIVTDVQGDSSSVVSACWNSALGTVGGNRAG